MSDTSDTHYITLMITLIILMISVVLVLTQFVSCVKEESHRYDYLKALEINPELMPQDFRFDYELAEEEFMQAEKPEQNN